MTTPMTTATGTIASTSSSRFRVDLKWVILGVCVALVLPILVHLRTDDPTTRRRSLAYCLFVAIAGAGWIATSTMEVVSRRTFTNRTTA